MAFIFDNPDKVEKTKRDLPCLPSWPFRALVSGSPGSGKRNTVLNIVNSIDIPDKIIVVHLDPKSSGKREYDFADEVLDANDPPSFDTLSNEGEDGEEFRTLIILDEIPFKRMSKELLSEYDRLLNFTSTHRNASVIIQTQQAMSVPPPIRRACNVIIICGGIREKPELSGIAIRSGLEPDDLKSMLGLFRSKHDTLTIDLSQDDPQKKYWLNLLTAIKSS